MMEEEIRCAECGEIIADEDDMVELDDGRVICGGCYDELYDECVFCEKVFLQDDMHPWGDECRICQDCLNEQIPAITDDDKAKATAAYEALCARFIGQKVNTRWNRQDQVNLWWDDGENVSYSMTVYLNDDKTISDISEIEAELVLYDGLKSHDGVEYPVFAEDYADQAAKEIEDILKKD